MDPEAAGCPGPRDYYRVSHNRVTTYHVFLQAHIMAQEDSLSLYYARFNNKHADSLNREAADVLAYQVDL